MKKTFRKALVLMTVVTVLTVCAFAMSASAADCHGTIDSWVSKYVKPTCTENGYTEYYCKDCGELASTTENQANPDIRDLAAGHKYLAIRYDKSADGTYYTRVVKCQAAECVRANGSTSAVSGTVKNCPTKYYLVEFANSVASPALGDVSNHEDYFLKGYYVKNSPSTWVVDLTDANTNDYITKTYAPISRVANTYSTDHGDYITEPDYEYFEEADGTVHLYVKEGSKAYADGKSAFKGVIPARNNDTTNGGYTFETWKTADGTDISAAVITENTTLYASFVAPENYTVSYTFKNGDTPIFESVQNVPYGSTVVYDGEEPKKAKTVESSYEFAGWRVENKNATDIENFAAIREPIALYHSHTVIYAQYKAIPNRYKIELVKYNGSPFTYEDGQPIKNDSVAFFEEVVSDDVVKSLDITRPNTETYTFAETNKWKIYAVNGYRVTGSDVLVGLDNLSLPQSVTVKGENGDTTIGYEDYDVISVSPVYLSQRRTYPVTVSIMHNYFEEEDLYDDRTPREDILDDFYVSVYDANGNVLDMGQTNSEGKVTLYIPFSTTWRFEAVTKNNKYFGYTVISPLSYDADSGKPVYEVIHIEGVGVAPSLSESWSEGVQQSCNCICHSFLSGLLIRIYNFIYRAFGIEYKCCDDLFAVHGDILVYD